jgi:branched-subunit amino acid aminotransferase/4-amino-4-deoxychorismate lyase
LRDLILAAVNGRVSPAAEARVSALDRGLLFGEAVYEVFVARRGRPLFWAEHRDRLAASALASGFDALPADLGPTLLREISTVCARLTAAEAYVRVVLTSGEDGLNPEASPGLAPTRIVLARPLTPLDSALRTLGCKLAPVAVPTAKAGVPVAKRTARPELAAERAAIHAAAAYESLRVDGDGAVLEGSSSSFFGVLNGVLRTAPLHLGVLAGITRSRVWDLANQAGLACDEVALNAADLPRLSEAFITSSTRGVVPVRAIGEVDLAAPGPTTAALTIAYDARVEAELG